LVFTAFLLDVQQIRL